MCKHLYYHVYIIIYIYIYTSEVIIGETSFRFGASSWISHNLRCYEPPYTFLQRKETTGHSPVLQVAGHGPVLPLASSPCAHAKKLRLIQHYCARFWQALLCKILARTGHGPVLSTGHGPVLWFFSLSYVRYFGALDHHTLCVSRFSVW